MAQVCVHQDVLESVLDADSSTVNPCYTDSPRNALREVSIGNIQNRIRTSYISEEALASLEKLGILYKPASRGGGSPEVKSSKAKVASRGPQWRSAIQPETFEPLDPVVEESSTCINPDCSLTAIPSQPGGKQQSGSISPDRKSIENHPLNSAEPKSPADEFLRHLAGQFDWLITCPRPASSASDRGSSEDSDVSQPKRPLIYGCNLLARDRHKAPISQKTPRVSPTADTFTLIATPLDSDAYASTGVDTDTIRRQQRDMALDQPPAYELHPSTPLKVPEVVEVFEQAVSPALTLTSERSSSFAGGSSRAGSFSVPRIEDSFEELDKLEEELEAIHAVANSRRVASPESKGGRQGEPAPQVKKPTNPKRASFVGQAATVRVKNSEKSRPSIRRSTSLVFREKRENGPDESAPSGSRISRTKSVNTHSTTPRGTIKSSKPPTVPNFELPGEAVARRLKEQREARKAHQAEAQKAAYVAPPRPRSSKPLTKPTFTLPGEAISRRKHEEREARLKAQEEEERKRREFKARPIRLSVTPSTVPRETITSLARQGKLPQNDEATKQADAAKSKRLSVGLTRGGSVSNRSPQSRGRLSTMVSHEDLSRATSTSTGSVSGKRSTLSVEEAQQLKLRGKEIFQRDNNRLKEDREREKREREAQARLAREQAAERSRAASREWAEKKRRKEQAVKDALRQQMAA